MLCFRRCDKYTQRQTTSRGRGDEEEKVVIVAVTIPRGVHKHHLTALPQPGVYSPHHRSAYGNHQLIVIGLTHPGIDIPSLFVVLIKLFFKVCKRFCPCCCAVYFFEQFVVQSAKRNKNSTVNNPIIIVCFNELIHLICLSHKPVTKLQIWTDGPICSSVNVVVLLHLL